MPIFRGVEYQQLYRIRGIPYLVSDLVGEAYRPLGILLTCRDGLWVSYIPTVVVQRTLAEGLELYGDHTAFTAYRDTFVSLQQKTAASFEQLVGQPTITRDECERFLDDIVELIRQYSKTEFIYTDEAARRAGEDPVLTESLRVHGALKNDARTYLNGVFFPGGMIERVLGMLGRQFGHDPGDLAQYSGGELRALSVGASVDGAVLADRRRAFFAVPGSANAAMAGDAARHVIATTFATPVAVGDAHVLHGTPASPGCVVGNVRVIAAGYDNFQVLEQLMVAMVPGEILVSETTSPDLLVACRKAAAIVTNEGGLLSRAGIISRELKIPCVVGTANATDVLHNGDEVEVDANRGTVRVLKHAAA